MQRFDCLAQELPLFGPHFLEASAGTGKTFAIEHIVARLIQSGVDIEQILVVTFTRAATRELKERIRKNLERYHLTDALGCYDRSQIFTIHGFCARMLKEYSFFGESSTASVDGALRDFFETLSQISPEQLGLLLRWAGSMEDLVRKLKKEEKPLEAKNFTQRCREFQYDVPEDLRAQFERARDSYKAMEGNFDEQLDAIIAKDLKRLVRSEKSIFEFTAPERRKVKATHTFDWGRNTAWPMIQEANDPKEILKTVLAVWKPIEEKVLDGLSPDQLLKTMVHAIQVDSFRQKIQQKYRAVLIDEFQDTDPIQWEIFDTLFRNAEALYLIGDPKQSIYRFRKADLYTYLKAKETIPENGHYYLDTNYRSSKPLTLALNALFDRQWLHLPKQKKVLPYMPVQAGLENMSDVGDGKGAVHWLYIDKEAVYQYVVKEILSLGLRPFSSYAVLVRDRFSAAEMQRLFAEYNIPSIARSQEPVTQSLAFESFVELFDALHTPSDLNRAKIVLAGPFGKLKLEEIAALDESPFRYLRTLLEEKGLVALFQELSPPPSFSQVLELLFEWERTHGFSFPGVFRFFESLEQMDPDEVPILRKETEEDAVQIMTMHVSKGLEFDIVFAIGASSRTPESDEEAEAEKLRQLYVAMTRAKRRLYIPIYNETKDPKPGTASPIELFRRHLAPDELEKLSHSASLTIEKIVDPIHLLPLPVPLPPTPSDDASVGTPGVPASLPIPPFSPSYLLSFTTLSNSHSHPTLEPIPDPQGVYTAQNLPRGAETGVIVHKIFERYFLERSLETIVEEEMGPLAPWKEVLISIVQQSLQLPLSVGFCLQDIDHVRTETEFLFPNGSNYIKGFIDLLFVHNDKLYFVDWKTNWLPEYSTPNLEEAIRFHQYDLQASIYTEALKRQWKGEIGGAIYLFVRGPSALCFTPGKYGH
jgi:exodeoxyribonuclease V beta subunit